jgi:hypothetical protein
MSKDYSDLFVKYYPRIYFSKYDPYLPADMDQILRKSKITKTISGKTYNGIELLKQDVLIDTNKDSLVLIDYKQKNVTKENMGKQILCRTSGIWSIKNTKIAGNTITDYIDLVYIITFSWNGTLQPHAFDKEEVVVRLIRNTLVSNTWSLYRVFGSAHGYGMWFNTSQLDFVPDNNNRVIMYSANESHAMYNNLTIQRRIFGFGDDVPGNDIMWEPYEFVVYNDEMDAVVIYDMSGNVLKKGSDTLYLLYSGNFGDNKDNQSWPGSIFRTDYNDTNNMDGYYKYSSMSHLFEGKIPDISPTIRYSVKYIALFIWILYVLYLIYGDYSNYITGRNGIGMTSLFMFLHLLLSVFIFLTASYLGLEIFALNQNN